MNEAVTLNCRFNEAGSQIPNALNTPATVGSEIVIVCGGAGPNFDQAKLKADALNQQEHTVKLLKYEVPGGNAQITFTSYRVGEYQDVQILLTDGSNIARTHPLSWKVQSVIDPQNPEAGQPFGPFGPWKISWPWWYFLILVLMLACLIFVILKTWRASKRKLEIQKKIREYRAKFNPFDQYQKTLRKLDRDFNQSQIKNISPEQMIDELRTASLTYLMMEFEIDTEKRTPKWIVKKIRKRARKARDSTFNDLALFLTEFQKPEVLDEVERMIDWAGRISEKVDCEGMGIKS